MTTHASGSTCVFVSAGIPVSNDLIGYAALSWTALGEVTQLSELLTTHRQIPVFNMMTNKEYVVKGQEQPSIFNMVVGYDVYDVGQILMSAQRRVNGALTAFKLVDALGIITFFSASVLSEGARYGGASDTVLTPYALGLQAPRAGDTIVIDSRDYGGFELREDGFSELREDDTKELRE